MGRNPMSPHTIKEILRLFFSEHSYGQIETKLHISKSAANRYVKRALTIGLTWDVIRDTPAAELAKQLSQPSKASSRYLEPNWAFYYRQMKIGNLKTIDDAFSNYCAQQSDKPLYGRSSFFQKYQDYLKSLCEPYDDAYFTHDWAAGEFCQIDFSGDGLQMWYETKEGFKQKKVEIFVAVLPFSRYLFCYAVPDQTRQSWLICMTEMFKFFHGVPKTIMLDNTTSLVIKASRHVPTICSEFEDLVQHYKTDAYPVAPKEPTYKGSVENAVGKIQEMILDRINQVSFFSLQEINQILRRELNRVNALPMKGFNRVSRKELFEYEVQYLKTLPQAAFEVGVRLKPYKVGRDFCIRLRGHRYSVPHIYIGKYVNVAIYPNDQLKVFDRDSETLITDHYYWGEKKCTSFVHIKEEHRPPNHITDQQRLKKAVAACYALDNVVGQFAERVVASMIYSCDGKKANLVFGIRSMGKKYGKNRLIKACEKALILGTPSYDLVKNLLEARAEEADYNQIGTQVVMDFMTNQGFLRSPDDFTDLINKMRK